jgi:hypothetical protein
MATKLGIYNRALIAMGERTLASLVEEVEPRRVLDDLYPDCLQFALEQGMWNFAMRNAALTPAGGGDMNYANVFTKPTDLVHLFLASEAAAYNLPLVNDFIDQQGQWFSNAATLYVRYSSNDVTDGGANLAKWSQTFTTYFVHLLAAWAAIRISGAGPLSELLEARVDRYLMAALAIDSVAMAPGLRPFDAQARAMPVEGHALHPIDILPFHAQLKFSAPAQPQGDQGNRGSK